MIAEKRTSPEIRLTSTAKTKKNSNFDPIFAEEIRKMSAYWHACNYLYAASSSNIYFEARFSVSPICQVTWLPRQNSQFLGKYNNHVESKASTCRIVYCPISN